MSNFYIPKYDCIFIHIPKTAGGAVRNLFFNKEYEGPFFGFNKIQQSKFSFCFVRNPYDRILSAYKFTAKKFPEEQRTFQQFLAIATDESIKYHIAYLSKHYNEFIRHHTLPQTHEYNCLNYATFVGRYENLQSDWKIVCKKIGAEYEPLPKDKDKDTKPVRSLSQKIYDYLYPEKSRINYYSSFFDNEQLKIINEYFKKDFEVLGYKQIKELP